MNETEALTPLAEAGQSIWADVLRYLHLVTIPGWRQYQIFIILGLIPLAYLLQFMLASRLDAWARRREGWPKWRLRLLIHVRNRLALFLYVAMIWAVYLLLQQVTWPSRSQMIGVVATMVSVWAVVGLLARLIYNRLLRRIISWALWISGTLYALNLDGAAKKILADISFSFGTMSFTLLTLLQAVILIALMLAVARIVTRRAGLGLQHNEDLSPSMRVLAAKGVQLVVYGIADRDCQGGESAGGLPPDAYRDWVGAVADGARGIGTTVAVLEPDAVADAGQCADADSRLALLHDAVDTLADAHVTTYVDGGHSDWVDPQEMASRLERAGVGDARGFATNVSFYADDAQERAYAEAVSQALGGSHYVIDTGRNGNGADGEWCNPPGRALGRTPAAGDGSLDAFLWIKPPGESDGSCNGGPPAGQWWDERALDLARAAGW